MKKFIAACMFAAAFAGGVAAADTMQNAYGNTITVTYPGGAVARYHFNADGTFMLMTPDHQHITGTYEIAGNQICLTPAGGQRGCTDYVAGKNVGDTWTQTGTDGAQITVALVAGR